MQILTKMLRKCLPSPSKKPALHPVSIPSYESLYDGQARAHPEDEVVGRGDFEAFGKVELKLLVAEGLRPSHTLIDFGCGNGRLAVHAIPFLQGGTYIGIDICQDFLRRAKQRIGELPGHACTVQWIHQTTEEFALAGQRADILCAFSVFTHMEHEDAYRYLKATLPVVRPGGKLMFSCLALDQLYAQQVFQEEASRALQKRWSRVRNVTTSKDMMTAIARLAGWSVVRWYDGDQIGFQSCCVLEAPAGA